MDELIRKGRAWKYGDNIDTDQIFPSKYMDIHEPPEAAKHLMEGADIQFAKKVREGDLLVAGKNFGLGSIRGGIHLAFEHLKLGGIIAESFSRGFFRSCISEGIPILECPGVGGEIDTGDTIEVNFSKGEVKNITKTKMVKGNKLPDFLIQKIIAGGSIALLTKMFSVERHTEEGA